MKAKLGLDGALDGQQLPLEYRVIKRFDHLTSAEFTEIAASLARWAKRVATG